MLDTSRSFYSVDTIKSLLDAMALAKFNVFHWHIVDDDSFPMELQKYPNLNTHGAFRADMVYTQGMMEEIVQYAANYSIRIIPEFDNPGHTRSIGLDPEFNSIIRCFDTD